MQSLCSFAPAAIPLLQPQGGVTASRTHSTLGLGSRDKPGRAIFEEPAAKTGSIYKATIREDGASFSDC